jgi:hypothetical protein
LRTFSIDGVPQKDLDTCLDKVKDLAKWSREEKIDRWALRASILKALYDDADEYFAEREGTFREIAAFDNGVATALRSMKDENA